MNKLQRVIISMIIIATSSLPVLTWACDALGPNRHVGVVTQIDPKAGTFTIIDAQRETPMTFTAQQKILDALKLDSEVIVTFRMDGQHMKAEAVVPAS